MGWADQSSGGSGSFNQSQGSSSGNSGQYWSNPGAYGALAGHANQLFGLNPSMNEGANLGIKAPNPYPTITTAPIWDANQINQNVNLMRAQNDAGTAGQSLRVSRDMAGHGYGAYSPIVAATQNNLWGQNRAGNAASENQLRFGAAQSNAEQILREQQADVQRTGMMNNDDFVRNQLAVQQDLQRRGLGLQRYGLEWNAKLAGLQAQEFLNQPFNFSRQQSTNRSFGGGGSFGADPGIQDVGGTSWGGYGAVGGSSPY